MGWLTNLHERLISSMSGDGPSTTKVVYLHAGLGAVYCAILGTVGGVAAYSWQRQADPIYWGANGALWVTVLGFASSTKKHAAAVTGEIQQAQGDVKPGGTD